MYSSAQKIKEKMDEFAHLFSLERNLFQRFVIVYKYICFLNSDPIVKDILQKIFDDTAKIIGEPETANMNEDQFLNVKGQALFSQEFWIYYNNLEIIYGKMKNMKQCCLPNNISWFEDLQKLFSKPYSKQMLELSFKVINSEIFDRLDKECFCHFDEPEEKTFFDEKKSLLFIKGQKVMINKQQKTTNAHKLLKYIFIDNKDNLSDDFYFSEIAEDEFHELDYKNRKNNWRKYTRTCEIINEKIEKVHPSFKKFLQYNTGTRGRVKINKKYL